MGVAYLCGIFFGMLYGFAVASLGYAISLVAYYYFGRWFSDWPKMQRKLTAVHGFFSKTAQQVGFFHLMLLSLIIPFLLLVPALGVLGYRKRKMLLAVYLGALPSLVLSVKAGSLGKSFLETQDPTFLAYSVAALVVVILIQLLVAKYTKKKSNTHE